MQELQRTTDDRVAGSIRIFLGVMFVMTGAMKLLVPTLAEAFSGQLLAAQIPFPTLNRWAVPFIEIAVGGVLLVGIFTRLAILVVVGIMVVAAYVHIVVDDPALFPLQPSEPVIPVIVIGLCGYLLWKGAGAWSRDLQATKT